MGSKVVVTYKRKRLFSRSGHSLANLQFDTASDSAKLKTCDSFPKQAGSIADCTLQKNDIGLGIFHAYSKDNTGEDVLQSEKGDSLSCSQFSEKYSTKQEMLCSACPEEKDCSAQDENQKFRAEHNCSPFTDRKQIISHPNVDGSPKVTNTVDSAGESNAEEKIAQNLKTSAGIDGSCQTKGTCIQKTSTFEETDKFNKDQCSSLYNNLSGIKRKLPSALITFCRRSKRNRADVAIDSESLPAASWLDLKDKVKLSNSVASNEEKDSGEQTMQQKVCMNVEGSLHINVTTQKLSNEDVKKDYLLHLDLSVPPRASHNIDCNLPLDVGCDENRPVETLEVLQDSLASASKIKEDMLSSPLQKTEMGSPVRAVNDKGKCIMNSPGNSLKNSYIQFLPESRSERMPNLANNSEKASPLIAPSLQSLNPIGLSLQPEQRACFPPLYEWPDFQPQPRESLLSLHLSTSDSFSRDKIMLDNILTRARAVRGNRSSFLDKFEYPTTWLEEELDSLWIGVRRHGRGNWDAILGDRRLHFLPWKTSWDLAERWQVEQSRLLCSMPLDFSSEHASTLHHSRHVELSLGNSNKMKKPVIGDKYSSTAAVTHGSLPHWLRTPAVPVVWLNRPTLNCTGTCNEPWLSNRCISELQNGGKTQVDEGAATKKEELIIIASDASSEETISD